MKKRSEKEFESSRMRRGVEVEEKGKKDGERKETKRRKERKERKEEKRETREMVTKTKRS